MKLVSFEKIPQSYIVKSASFILSTVSPSSSLGKQQKKFNFFILINLQKKGYFNGKLF